MHPYILQGEETDYNFVFIMTSFIFIFSCQPLPIFGLSGSQTSRRMHAVEPPVEKIKQFAYYAFVHEKILHIIRAIQALRFKLSNLQNLTKTTYTLLCI